MRVRFPPPAPFWFRSSDGQSDALLRHASRVRLSPRPPIFSWGVAKRSKARDFDSRIRWFEPSHLSHIGPKMQSLQGPLPGTLYFSLLSKEVPQTRLALLVPLTFPLEDSASFSSTEPYVQGGDHCVKWDFLRSLLCQRASCSCSSVGRAPGS